MPVPDAIATYIRAKDCNRPYLMEAAFTKDATVEMVVTTAGMSFPPQLKGIEELTQVLVSRFNQTYENIHTFCLSSPPGRARPSYSCDWLVGMSEKDSRAVRVGCGRYDWGFRAPDLVLVERLRITIEHMQSLPSHSCPDVMSWLARLPYPWCNARVAAESMPDIGELRAIAERLARVHE